ncbi:MAG: SusC/RagA family TonB-linked outer membrane protein [Capnocytophaga sp.]|nr:SusC/RagA family TonB-linked outer membrane protein [Capnocytophaga sp.]
MKVKVTWMVALFFMALQLSFAQEKTVTGTIKDGSGIGLPGVAVLVKGEGTGTQTDFDGNYSIRVAPGKVLEFSYLGMKTTERTVGASDQINVTMEEDALILDDVVVMGYVKRTAQNTTGSSQQISASQIENPASVNPEAALQGQVAGVQAVAASGTPGAQQDIRIRGVGSFSASNRPLYVIDGVPVNDDNFGIKNNDGTIDFSTLSPMASIPSQDIESITVLKDASATAAYGARGSNGVIVITTKRGKSGKAKFTLSSNVGFQNDAYNKRDMLTAEQRLTLLQEGLVNQRSITPDAALAVISDNNLGNYNGWVAEGRPNGDWAEAIRNNNALTYEHAFSASGGGEGTKYYFSLNHNKTEATVIGTGFQRTAANVKIDADLNSKTKIQSSVLLSKVDQDPILEQSSFFDNPFLTRYLMTPWYSPYNAEGEPNINGIARYTSVYNTLYTNKYNKRNNRILRALANVRVDYEIVKNLTLANNFAMDYNFRDFQNFQNRYHGGGVANEGTSSRNHRQNVNFVNQTSLNWNKTFNNKHSFDVLALVEYQKNQNYVLSGYGQKFPIDGLTNIANAGADFQASSSYEDFIQSAVLGMFNYSYDNRFVLDATFRREGSSKFAPDHRYGNFWSAGIAYNLHRDILREVFDELRIRSSYGTTGNAGIDVNLYQDLMAFNRNYGESVAGYPKNYANNELTWEKNRSFDVGLDFALFDRKLSGSVGYYNKLTYDLLQYLPLTRTSGFDEQMMNVGDMRNSGFEVTLAYAIFNNEKFKWSVNGNFSTLKNEIVRLGKDSFGNDLVLFPGSTTRGGEVGTSYNYWNMRKWAGVDPATGAPQWYVNGVDGATTTSWGDAGTADQGVSIPKFQGGLGTRIDIGPVFVNVLFTFQGGHKIYETFAQFYMRTNNFTLQTYNGAAELLDRWQQAGDVTDVPRLNYNANNNFHAASTRWLYDGTFVRLRNLQVGYSLDSEYLGSIGIDRVTLQLTGSNLLTWVKDKNLKLDPETRADGSIQLTTPPVKTVMAGLTLNF